MTTLWEESNVKINHPGEQELQQGDMEERTENILYPTNDAAYERAVRIYYFRKTGMTVENEKAPISYMLKTLYDKIGEEKARAGINRIMTKGQKCRDSDGLDCEPIPKHNHLRQVDGAAEVFALVGGKVDKESITYEKIREQSVETMRQNKTYQFCMLLAGFNNDKIEKYYITPSERLKTNPRKRPMNSTRDNAISDLIVEKQKQLDELVETEKILKKENIFKDAKKLGEVIDRETKSPIDRKTKNVLSNPKTAPMVLGSMKPDKPPPMAGRAAFGTLPPSPPIIQTRSEMTSPPAPPRTPPKQDKKDWVEEVKREEVIKSLQKQINDLKDRRRQMNKLSFHDWYSSTSWADGRLHLSPLIYAHIEEAFNVVRRKWMHLKKVPLSLFIESPDVRSYFARLVAWCMRTSDCLSGKRFHLQSTYSRVNHEKIKLLNIFRHVRRIKDILVYDRQPDVYPYVDGTQTNINKYLDNKQLSTVLNPSRGVESSILRNMHIVNKAMTLSKSFNNII